MSSIAISAARMSRSGGKIALKPWMGPAAAAALFIAAAVAVVMLMGPVGGRPVRISLSSALAAAPQSWRQALRPANGVAISEDILRLADHPLTAASATAGWIPNPSPKFEGGALPPAPISGFYAPGPSGPLPIIAQDGRTPFQIYSRPFVSNGRPKIGLIIGGLGLDARESKQAIETLPPQITLAFSPYAEGLQGWIDMARAHGHEVLLETPMEPLDYPDNDPGPYTLLADASPPETARKLEWILSRATGYFGLTNYLGSRFLSDGSAYSAFINATRGRGLGFIDDGLASQRAGGGLPRASADRVIDSQLSRTAIDQQLLQLEAGALQHGQALGDGFAYPVTLEMVAKWAGEVEQRGYQLAPASALASKK